jgi:hypothetical protein
MANAGYLEKDRLALVIAAIQIMGVSDRAAGSLNRWINELDASEALPPDRLERLSVHYSDRKKWAAVFDQHPEFFKTYSVKGEPHVALRWRFSQSIKYDPGTETAEFPSPIEPGKDDERTRIARQPLTAEQIAVLITTAIELHGHAAGQQQPMQQTRPLLLCAFGALLGAVIGGGLVAMLGWEQTIRIFH